MKIGNSYPHQIIINFLLFSLYQLKACLSIFTFCLLLLRKNTFLDTRY